LVNLQPDHFELHFPERPGAEFMKLKYQIPGTFYKINIDLLLSTAPNLEIPSSFRRSHFVHLNHLPVAPLYFVLYHKLLGWEDRVNSSEEWKQRRAAEVDHPDIISLCSIADRYGIKPLSKSHMGRVYLSNFRRRANDFLERYGGETENDFRRLGFPVWYDSEFFDDEDFAGY
jgi:hypothetical protein